MEPFEESEDDLGGRGSALIDQGMIVQAALPVRVVVHENLHPLARGHLLLPALQQLGVSHVDGDVEVIVQVALGQRPVLEPLAQLGRQRGHPFRRGYVDPAAPGHRAEQLGQGEG